MTHRTSHITHRTSHIAHRTSPITHHTSHIAHQASHIAHRTSHIAHRTSHITHRTSHIAHQTSHIPQEQVHLIPACQLVANATDYCVVTQLVKADGKHQKDDVTILHVVCLKGFEWIDSETNKPPTCCCYVNQNGKDVCCGIMFALQQHGQRFACFFSLRLLRSTLLQVYFLEHVNNVQKGAACTALACRPRSCNEQCNHNMVTKRPDLVSIV